MAVCTNLIPFLWKELNEFSDMRRPLISFIVPAYNCANYLNEAIASIIEGNASPDDEIIIVDDASLDNTPRVIERLAAKHSQIRVIRHRYNRGSAAAGRNTAIEAARHDIFFALDADNLLVQGSVSPLVQFMFDEGADAAAFQEVRFFSHSPEIATHSWFYTAEITLADALAGHQWPGPDGNYMFTRDCWLCAGRYDEFVGGGIDSWAFGIRQLVSGSRMVTLPNSYYLHRWGHNSAWLRDSKLGWQSVKALRVLLPYLELLAPESIEYVFCGEGRESWFENLKERPLRLRDFKLGECGRVVWNSPVKDPFLKRLRRFLARKLDPT
jgi:glycosyltransferase involved in cell wall biosynthesis